MFLLLQRLLRGELLLEYRVQFARSTLIVCVASSSELPPVPLKVVGLVESLKVPAQPCPEFSCVSQNGHSAA